MYINFGSIGWYKHAQHIFRILLFMLPMERDTMRVCESEQEVPPRRLITRSSFFSGWADPLKSRTMNKGGQPNLGFSYFSYLPINVAPTRLTH